MAGSVAMTGVAMIGVVMMVEILLFVVCWNLKSKGQNGCCYDAMIKFCEFYFLASMLYLDGSCLLLFRPRLRAVRAVQSWV
ncbi:hypothetical protein BD770DRAFT_478044 [Pilaira anomala]|nr:hypothetical protein BD770DRAFT_478044 [Pilaira anomala]